MTKSSSIAVSLFIIIAVGLFILAPFQHAWFPQTADGEYYSARLANFYRSIQAGSFPPRWAPSFYSGLGSPVFNFNYPMPNLLGSVFLGFGASVAVAMKAIIIFSYLAGGIGIYFVFKRIFTHPLAPVFGSVLYMTAPYQIHDIFHRATTGEIMMFGLLPYVLLVLETTARNKFPPASAALVYAVYFLTHNLYALMFLPLISAFIANFYGWPVFRANRKPLLAGLLISMFFWLPALTEMKYTVLTTAHINYDYPTELLSLRQTLKIPGFYTPKTTPLTLDSDQPGLAQLFVLIAALIVLKFYAVKISRKTKQFAAVSIGFFLTALFLLNHASLPVWQTFSAVRFMQHPIRLYFIPVFFGAYLGAFLIESSRLRYLIAAIAVGLTVYNYRFFAFRPVEYVPFEDSFFYHYPLTSAADNEFDTIWYDRAGVNRFFIQHNFTAVVASPSAVITMIKKDLFSKTYQVDTKTPVTIIEETQYFPGWITTIDGAKIDIRQSANRYFGLINFSVPPGRHQITTRFTQQTPPRLIGNSVSVIGLLLAAGLRRKSK
ncbi:hypothetical protein A3B57_01425 [Microgenomates group bacterium RIFCSPLOWO2_01_FULL_47_10]|nr:MAG: hypothetical protein A3B57_01425 [Microgenomates group bacterium RIFCSPLOWO2_01_FULL_47_10]